MALATPEQTGDRHRDVGSARDCPSRLRTVHIADIGFEYAEDGRATGAHDRSPEVPAASHSRPNLGR